VCVLFDAPNFQYPPDIILADNFGFDPEYKDLRSVEAWCQEDQSSLFRLIVELRNLYQV
jgi:hypothetical protein